MYQIKLTEEELTRLNLVNNQNIRESLMSLYAYMLKTNQNYNNTYSELGLEKDSSILQISLRKLLEKYKRYHSVKNLQTLKNRIDKLVELGLISVKKPMNKSTYTFCRFYKKLDKKLDIKNIDESIENASIDTNCQEPKYLNSRTLDLDSNSCTATEEVVVDNSTVKINIENEEKISNWDYVDDLIKNAFKSLHVRSAWIKTEVIEKLFKYYRTITKRYAMSYVYKTIASVRTHYYANYDRYVKSANTYKNAAEQKNSTFNNFKQRNYDFKDLEKKLLGWD